MLIRQLLIMVDCHERMKI